MGKPFGSKRVSGMEIRQLEKRKKLEIQSRQLANKRWTRNLKAGLD